MLNVFRYPKVEVWIERVDAVSDDSEGGFLGAVKLVKIDGVPWPVKGVSLDMGVGRTHEITLKVRGDLVLHDASELDANLHLVAGDA